jgi:hypothetical protein
VNDDSGPLTPDQPIEDKRGKQLIGRLPALVIAAALTAIGLFALQQANQACACVPTDPPLPSSPVDGQVIAVNSPALGKVEDFTLRIAGGRTITLTVGLLENPTEFSPSHLTEHMATSSPVRAFFRVENGIPTVYRLEDAAEATPTPGAPAAT